MPINVDHNDATATLMMSLERVRSQPVGSCQIKEAIDTVMNGKLCLTYQYVLFTALAAKATNEAIDILSLQTEDDSVGAYAPRTICSDVVYPFQKKFLADALDGSNADPLVNKPARYPRLDKRNAARGDGRIALNALCDALPTIKTSKQATECLDYLMSRLLAISVEHDRRRFDTRENVEGSSLFDLQKFLSDLLDQGFGGLALVLVSDALYRIEYPEAQGFEVVPHPVNQSGRSSSQFSDLDLFLNGEPYLGTELKDKPFTESDVRRAADTAYDGNVHSLLFIAGRQSTFGTQTPAYFSKVREDYSKLGIYVGIVGIDALVDQVLVSNGDIDVPDVLMSIYNRVRDIGGTPEAQMWIYERYSSLK